MEPGDMVRLIRKPGHMLDGEVGDVGQVKSATTRWQWSHEVSFLRTGSTYFLTPGHIAPIDHPPILEIDGSVV